MKADQNHTTFEGKDSHQSRHHRNKNHCVIKSQHLTDNFRKQYMQLNYC